MVNIMKRFKYNWFVRARPALLGAMSLAFMSTVQANPVWHDPANPLDKLSADYCMADAYFATGGKGLKDVLDASLNCTANDVEITTVTVKLVDNVGPDIDPITGVESFTCTDGELMVITANLKVRTNANERWDTTFFLPLNQKSPQVIQQDENACSIVIPRPIFTDDPDSGVSVAQQLDGDTCGDIAKGPLVNDEYTLVDATFTMLCDGGEDTQVDFNYCAGWDNQERDNCAATGLYPGQEPNTTSKCNCDIIPLNIFIQPDPPLVTKTLVSGSPANEPTGTYIYKLRVETQSPETNLEVTDLSDYVWSLTDDDDTLYEANLVTGTIAPTGSNLTLLVADSRYTCDTVGLPKVLNAEALAFECAIVVQIDDEDLPNDGTSEFYRDVIKVIARDDNEDNIGDCIEPLTGSTVNGSCSNEIVVAIDNVNPEVTITKTPISGPGLRQVPATAGPYFVDNEGLITYELVITNISSVDDVWLTVLIDDNGTPSDLTDDIDLLADSSGSPACNSAPQAFDSTLLTTSGAGSVFTCQYVMDVAVDEGDEYTNKVDVTVTENEARLAEASATATITRAEPMLTLSKHVAESINTAELNPALDSGAFMDSIKVDEPGDTVVYRFTINNANSATQEALTLTSLTDNVLFTSARATKAASQRSDECTFPTVVIFGTPYVCTIVAEVTGDATDVDTTAYDDTTFENTAYASATAPNGSSVDSNTDKATVNFENVTPTVAGDFAVQATVFLRIENTSTFEKITLTHLKVLNNTVADDTTLGTFKIINQGAIFFDGTPVDACPEPDANNDYDITLAAGGILECAFTVEFSAGYTASDFASFTADASGVGALFIQFVDNDGSTASADAEVKVQTNLP
jgi:hypothetical protein